MEGRRRAGSPEVEVRLLGPTEAERDGGPVTLGGQKPRALLAALALEPGRAVSVDRLVEALWPGDPPDTAGHAVQVYVSQLRKALGPVITTRAPGYVLELEPERVDVHRFTRLAQEGRAALGGDPIAAEGALREALALWRGPALADFLYEPFAQMEIARLEDLRTAVLEARIDADLALGRHAELGSELEALIQAQPLRERPRAQLMLALYRSGRQADALAAYRAARETLVEELGIDPGPELRELEAAILRQDESLSLEEAPLARPAMQFRRLVTILFVDVVESMSLAESLDPEALGRVLQGYFETVSAAITRHGGAVEKYAGDAVMAAFGIPVSHEDDALRAARAALDIRAAIAALNEQLVRKHGIGLEIRVGIDSGEVVATPTDARQRLVTGEAVGIAAKLEAAAGPDEIVVGEVTGRLIDHAALLEPLGEMAIKGKREPVLAYRLVELAPVTPAFEQRQEARLVGRKRELAALRRVLKRSADGSEVRVAVVVGLPGAGKSRLAAELAGRTKGLTTLWGRCLSYGDGITYWPLREVLEQADESDERDAVLAALDAEAPPPAPEIAWLFRQFSEASAREKPLLLVFDDIHWAEPTFLELVEHLADKGNGAIAVVCLAREELLEDRPAFLEGRANASRILLDALSAEDTDALVTGLGGTVLESDQRDRIAEAAEGNPLFVEQLLALALEGGLAERALPETIQALLAARLDRLGPGERAVLERGAIVGKEFRADDVVALLDPDAAPTADAHLETLVGRGFVRGRGEGAFGFRHVLVQDAVYRAAPKRLRAELHERYADRLDTESPDLPELDEFVGYHLEQAYRLRTELGESDRRVERLAEDGGGRLGAAGARGLKRGDMHASLNLLGRAASLLPTGAPARGGMLCDLGLTRHATGDPSGAIDAFMAAIDESRTAGDLRVVAWARIECEYVRTQSEPKRSADDLLGAIDDGMPILETAGDHRSLARALMTAGFVRGGRRGDHTAWKEAAERALVHYKAGGWSTSSSLGQIAAAMYWGPTHVADAIARCEELLATEVTDRPGEAYLMAFLGGFTGQQGEFDRARALADEARRKLGDLGLNVAALTFCSPVRAHIEELAQNGADAVRVWRELCDQLAGSHQVSQLATAAGELADALVAQGSYGEALQWTDVAERHTAADDVDAQLRWCSPRVLIYAHAGEFARAEELGRSAALLADGTDDVNHQARVRRHIGEAHRLAGRATDAALAFQRAIELYELKGNIAAAAEIRALQDELVLA